MQKTKTQMFRFCLAGFAAVFTDWLSYFLLSGFIAISIAKGLSYLIGTIVAYLINKYYTFEVKEKSIKEAAKFLILYILSLGANVIANKLSLAFVCGLIEDFSFAKIICVIIATALSAAINFLGQKFWVFRTK